MKTIQMTIDEPLLRELDAGAEQDSMARSAFMRKGLRQFLRIRQLAEWDRQDRAAYAADPQTAEEIDEWLEVQAWDLADGGYDEKG